jgi:hypothetical protein
MTELSQLLIVVKTVKMGQEICWNFDDITVS